MKNFFRPALGALLALLGWLLKALGGWDAALGLMFLLMGLDLLTGLTVALLRKSDKTPQGGFRSQSFFLGLTRKLLMVALVILGTALDALLGSALCRLSVIGFYSANEAFSIVENAALCGVPFPKGLLRSLERYREKMDGAETGEGQGPL